MSQAQTFYEANPFYGGLTWLLVTEQIGQDLRERYQVPQELPPKMVALVRKLDAIEIKSSRARSLIGTLDALEGNQLLRRSGTQSDREQMIEARIVGGVKAFPDWYALT
jgi:hypothetical protein